MIRLLYLALTITIMASIVACDGQPPSAKKATKATKAEDDPLNKVSPFLGFMEIEMKIEQQANCTMRDTFAAAAAKRDTKSDVADRVIEKLRLEADAKCTLFRGASEKGAPVFQAIRQRGALPAESYVFTLLEDSEKEITKKEIGLFASAADCDLLESFARDHEFGTIRCRRWSPP